MKYKNNKNSGLMIVMFSLLVVIPTAVFGQKTKVNENSFNGTTFTGTIVTFNGNTPTFSMEIKSITSDKEVKDDLKILRSKGQNGFMKAIEKQNLGYFSLENHVGQQLKYVTQTKTDTGTKIVAVFERWIEPFEIRSGSISTDYPFTYIELFIDNNGKGSGTVIGAARVKIDKKNPNSIDFDNFGAYPAKLIGIQMDRKEL